MRYYIIAGEASGDLHGSNLMKGIYAEDPSAVVRFRGGDCMMQVCREMDRSGDPLSGLSHHYKEGAVMGVVEILLKAKHLLSNMEDCRRDILEFKPDVLILIDYPGFNLRMAQWAHEQGLKVFYYIAPKVWASREGRIEKMRRYIDELFIVFPFEKEYFDSKGLPYHYQGNPLVDAVENSHAMTTPVEQLKEELGLDRNDKVIAMLAGSRKGEIGMMMPMLREVAAMLHAQPRFAGYKFLVAGAPSRSIEDYGEFDTDLMRVVFGKTQEIVRVADAAVINSGTASLEAVLLGTPQVVAYRFPIAISNFLAYFFIKVKYISLGNLCLNRLAFKELYHKNDCNAKCVAREIEALVTDKKYRTLQLEEYAAIKDSLGGSGASRRVAREMIDCLSR